MWRSRPAIGTIPRYPKAAFRDVQRRSGVRISREILHCRSQRLIFKTGALNHSATRPGDSTLRGAPDGVNLAAASRRARIRSPALTRIAATAKKNACEVGHEPDTRNRRIPLGLQRTKDRTEASAETPRTNYSSQEAVGQGDQIGKS